MSIAHISGDKALVLWQAGWTKGHDEDHSLDRGAQPIEDRTFCSAEGCVTRVAWVIQASPGGSVSPPPAPGGSGRREEPSSHIQDPGSDLVHFLATQALSVDASRTMRAVGRSAQTAARLPWRGDALRQARSCRSPETHLPLLFVHIDANIGYGWSPLCGMDRVMVCGAEATTCE